MSTRLTEKTIRFKGVSREGAATTGAAEVGDVADWVFEKYAAGWRSLTVTTAGEEVGGIGPAPDGSGRTWWGERSYPTPWTATTHKMRAHDYRGVIERMASKTRANSKRCPHAHRTRQAAARCADLMLRAKQRDQRCAAADELGKADA